MRAKLLMTWDVNPGSESDYSEFIVHEFMPRLKGLGLSDVQFWYTSYGQCEQIMASGETDSLPHMRQLLTSSEWDKLSDRLTELVTDFTQKVIPAAGGFQL